MAPRKKPDATDTEPPEEARPNTTATPLIVEDGQLLSPTVRFTAVQLLRWFEDLADKNEKLTMGERAWEYVLAIVGEEWNSGRDLSGIEDSWWKEHNVPAGHRDLIRQSIGNVHAMTPEKASGFLPGFGAPSGQKTPAKSSMSGGSADSEALSVFAEIMKESRESMADMQERHERAAADQAKAATELSIKAIQAVAASNAKIAVQPATLNCGTNGITPSPADVFAFLEDIKTRYNAIINGIRAFIARIIRDPTGTASEFQACLTEAERKELFVCINEKIPRALLRNIWDPNKLDGAGLLHALLQHAINSADMSISLKRATLFYDTKALNKHQNFQAEHLELQRKMMNVRWTVGTKPADLIGVVKGVYSNYHTISTSISEFWDASRKDQEAVDETMAQIPRYMDRYMELNRLTTDKEESKDWQDVRKQKRERAHSDPSPHRPEGDVRERTPLRSQKPPLEMTAEKKRIENGPCKWHKKGICEWKEYCNMDHSAAAMAKLPVVQPRPPPRSVRHASAVSEKEDEKDTIIAALAQRLEQLEGKLTLMFRDMVPNAGVRNASIPPVPRPTSYLAAVQSHLSRTEVWSKPTTAKMRAPGYLPALRKHLEMTRINQGIPPKINKGPLIDSCADVNVCAESDKHLLSNIRAAPDISIEGITGQVKPKLMGDRMVGGIAVQEMMLLPGAKESVVAHAALWADPNLKSITELRDSKGLVYENHVVKCIAESGGRYRLPVSNVSVIEKQAEWAVSEAKVQADRDASMKQILLNHQLEGHMLTPPKGWCATCDAASKKHGDGDGKLPFHIDYKENEIMLAADFMIFDVKSSGGNNCLLNVVTHRGLGACIALPNKEADTVLGGLKLALQRIRTASGGQKKVVLRFHTDDDTSFKGSVKAFAAEEGWLQTTTAGYDHNATAQIERRNRKLLEITRKLLLDATGGRTYYEEIWDEAMSHACDVVNNMPEASDLSPVEKEGGKRIDFKSTMNVFGSRVYFYVNKILRSGKVDITTRQGIWVGRSHVIAGGHRILPITYNTMTQVWDIGKAEDIAGGNMHSNVFPLRTTQSKMGSATDFESFVDRLSTDAIPTIIFEAEEILDMRIVESDREYKIQWHGYGRRDATWEPESHLLQYGATELIAKYEAKQTAAGNKKMTKGIAKKSSVRTASIYNVYHTVKTVALDVSGIHSAVILTVMEAMRKQKLPGQVASWVQAYNDEIKSLEELRMTRLEGAVRQEVLKNETVIRMVMRYEPKKNGRCKCRLVVRGDMEPDEWFNTPTDSPTAMSSTIKTLLACGSLEKNVRDDITSAGDVDRAFCKSLLFGPEDRRRFVCHRCHKTGDLWVWELRGGVYGQKDAAIRWWNTFAEWMTTPTDQGGMGFEQGQNDLCLFFNPVTLMRIACHVDDILARGNRKESDKFWNAVDSKFGLKEWHICEYDNPISYLSLRIKVENRDGVDWYSIDQSQDLAQFIVDEGMANIRPVSAPMPDRKELLSNPKGVSLTEHKWIRSTVGSLSYFATHSRPDIAYEVNRVSQCLEKPTQGTILAVRRIIAFIAGTLDFQLEAPRVKGTDWHLYSDSDHAGDRAVNGTKSVTGVVFLCNGMPIHWRSKKQPATSTSSAAAEIYAFSEAVRDAQVRFFIAEEMGIAVKYPIEIFIDNAAGVSFQRCTNPDTQIKGVFDLRDEWVRELRNSKKVSALKVDTAKNIADMMTKCLSATVRERLMFELSGIAREIARKHLGGT